MENWLTPVYPEKWPSKITLVVLVVVAVIELVTTLCPRKNGRLSMFKNLQNWHNYNLTARVSAYFQ